MPSTSARISLVVGLGNPGEEYATTRHNAGFLVVDRLGEKFGARYWKQAAGALVAEVLCEGRALILAKPQSYMNTSGGPVKKLLDRYGLSISELLVVHDELDIPAGGARIKLGGGHAGHNGLRSIIDQCGSRDFGRIRVGIGRPPGKMPVADFVLSTPRKDDALEFDAAVFAGVEAVLACLHWGVDQARARGDRF